MELIDTEKRLDLIEIAATKLDRGLSGDEIDTLTNIIIALCRHRDLPLDVVMDEESSKLLDYTEGEEE